MRKFLPLLLLLIAVIPARSQTAVYVDSSITTSGAGTSWATAYKMLSDALTAVNAASTSTKYVVYVAKGTYYPAGVQTSTNRDSAFLLIRGGISIEGGYPAGGGTRNITANPTVLSGNIGLAADSTDNSYHVLVVAGIPTTDTVSLSGLTVYGGAANGPVSQGTVVNGINISKAVGGGMVVQSIRGSLLISDCTFYRNMAGYYGGGIYRYSQPSSATGPSSTARMIVTGCSFMQNNGGFEGGGLEDEIDGTSDTVTSCTFTGNRATRGGGAFFRTSSRTGPPSYLFLSGSTFSNNNAGALGGGGGAYVFSSTYYNAGASVSTVNGCTFNNNYGNSQGGGMVTSVRSGTTIRKGTNYITGCTITNNVATDGGGLYSYVDGGGPVIGVTVVSNCRITGNTAMTNGGGMYNYVEGADSLTIRSTLDSGNTAGNRGAGMYNRSSVILDSVTVIKNSCLTYGYGGGIFNTLGVPQISRCLVAGNSAVNGGGMYNLTSNPVLKSCLFSGNLATGNGGAMYNYTGSSPAITNCTLAGDSATLGSGLYDSLSASAPVVLNSIIWEGANAVRNASGGSATITYSTVSGGYPGTGNLSSNPLFVNPVATSAAPTVAGNYALTPCSPAVDAGLNSGSYTGLKDFAGNGRLYGAVVDMGAYESQTAFPAPITSVSSAVCVNSSVQLSNAIGGGTWTSNNPAIATVSSGGLVTGIAAGTATIAYSYTGGSCTGTATKAITVNALPAIAAITGATAVCTNTPVMLANATSGGVWSSTNTAVATISGTGLLTGIAAGTDTIKYTVTAPATGCANAAVAVVTVNASPVVVAITGSPVLCGNATLQLGNATAGGVWTSRDTGIAVVSATGLASPRGGGSTSITYTVTNSAGCTDSAVFALTVDMADVTVTQVGAVLTAASQTGAAWQWIDCGNGNTAIAGETGQSFTAAVNGSYAVVITKNGCSYTSACKTVSGLGIRSLPGAPAAVQVYPNPGTGLITVSTPGRVGGYIRVEDLAGKQLLSLRPTGATTRLDLRPFGPGVYLVAVYEGLVKKTVLVSVQ